MILSVVMPDPIARELHLDGVRGQRLALEMLALEAYRTQKLSRGQIGELLGLSFHETEQFLHANHAEVDLSLEEIVESSAELERMLLR